MEKKRYKDFRNTELEKELDALKAKGEVRQTKRELVKERVKELDKEVMLACLRTWLAEK